jgi:hypothetical protein
MFALEWQMGPNESGKMPAAAKFGERLAYSFPDDLQI